MKTPTFVLLALMASSCLHADELSDLKKENESLKRKVAELRRQVQSGKPQNTTPATDPKAGIRAKYEEEKILEIVTTATVFRSVHMPDSI